MNQQLAIKSEKISFQHAILEEKYRPLVQIARYGEHAIYRDDIPHWKIESTVNEKYNKEKPLYQDNDGFYQFRRTGPDERSPPRLLKVRTFNIPCAKSKNTV